QRKVGPFVERTVFTQSDRFTRIFRHALNILPTAMQGKPLLQAAPGPEKGGIGVPSVLLPAIWLFLNDCIVAPAKLTPVALPEIVAPPIRTIAAAPDARTPVPKLFTTLVPVIIKLRNAVAMTRTPSPSLVATTRPALRRTFRRC